MNCTNCGAALLDNARFCPKCGSKVSDADAADATVCIRQPAEDMGDDRTVSVRQPESVTLEPTAHVTIEPPVEAEPTPEPPSAPPKKSKKGLIITLIIVFAVLPVVVAVIAGLAFGGWAVFAFMQNTKADTNDTLLSETVAPENSVAYMPYCRGWSVEEVDAHFAGKTYTIRYEYSFDDEVEEGRIISQNVAEGTELYDNSVLVFTVSKGSDACPDPYTQKLVLSAAPGSQYGELGYYTWTDGRWALKYTCSASLGKNGIGSNYGEGKGITPAGTYKLGVVLSQSSLSNTSWPYRKVTKSTCIVDDTSSPYYNMIMDTSSLPGGTHYDAIGDTIVRGITNKCMYIEHNGDGLSDANVVPGKGSAITICAKSSSLRPTAGCIDISTADFNMLMGLLDYSQNPHIEIVTE